MGGGWGGFLSGWVVVGWLIDWLGCCRGVCVVVGVVGWQLGGFGGLGCRGGWLLRWLVVGWLLGVFGWWLGGGWVVVGVGLL